MSGPKKSYWEIQEEIRRKREEEKRRKRMAQINEIKDRLQIIQNKISSFDEYTKRKITSWIREIDLNGDLRLAFRSLKGIERYVGKIERKLEEKRKIEEQKKLEEELRQEKISSLIEDLEAVKEEFKDILNSGILQRIEMFKKAVSLNPDNENTLKQIKQFKNQLQKMQEEALSQKENVEYVADVFSKMLHSDVKREGNDLEINGEIDGVPIKVRLYENSKNIDFDTPSDASCKDAISKINQKLKENGINLGPVKVVKTGAVLNEDYTYQKERVRQ